MVLPFLLNPKMLKNIFRKKILKNISLPSFPECEIGNLLANTRKTRNGLQQHSDSNNNQKKQSNRQSEPLQLRNVGKSPRYAFALIFVLCPHPCDFSCEV